MTVAIIYSYRYIFDAEWDRMLENNDLDEMIHSGKRIGIRNLFDIQDVSIIREEINAFLRQLLEERISPIDSIVGIERKGYRIFRNFLLENPEIDKVELISSNKIDLSNISGKRVLVFDDSVHEGRKALAVIRRVKRLGATEVRFACLLCNNVALSSLSALPDVLVSPCKPPFSSYDEQSQRYWSWEVPYLSTLRVKDNPDYPMMVLRTEGPAIDDVDAAITPCFKSLGGMVDRYVNGEEAVDDALINITVEYEPRALIPPETLAKIADVDSSKIRYLVRKHPDRIDIEIISLISPIFASDVCDAGTDRPRRCMANGENSTDEKACGFCHSKRLNRSVLERLLPELKDALRRAGWPCTSVEIIEPELRL